MEEKKRKGSNGTNRVGSKGLAANQKKEQLKWLNTYFACCQ